MHHTRVLELDGDVLAFYDGRIDGYRFAPDPNWVDDGALSLGIASYALVSDGEAVVYDTHVSVEHGQYIREVLERRGVHKFTVVLSHWHLDHVAGTVAFNDCEIVASERTAELMARYRPAIERGEQEGPPAIDPLLLPTSVFSDRRQLTFGGVRLELIHVNIHSDDATVVWLPERRLLLCGDTLEDPVTYVDEPQSFDHHLADLAKLRELKPNRILANHGDPEVIAAGGNRPDLIDATEQYIRLLQRSRTEPRLRDLTLRELIADSIEEGAVHYFAPYESVHRHNVEITAR